MTKYTANIIGIAKTSSGPGVWDLYDQGELVRNGRWGSTGVGNSGGNIINGQSKTIGATTYKYHTFTADGTFTVGTAGTCEILLVAGGGPGGYPASSGPYPATRYGGGGGAGGVIYANAVPLSEGIYDVSVGTGGTGGANGTDSTLYSRSLGQNVLIAKGGACAGQGSPAQPGGSGGGGSLAHPAGSTGIQTTTPQYFPSIPINNGNPGRPSPGGGGGGGGGAGPSQSASLGGNSIQITPNYIDFYGDTIGLPALNPLNSVFGAGGGGSTDGSPLPSRFGGLGGGNGAGYIPVTGDPRGEGRPNIPASSYSATNATVNTGGGGGGGMGPLYPTPTSPGPSINGTNGAPGIVVIRYVV